MVSNVAIWILFCKCQCSHLAAVPRHWRNAMHRRLLAKISALENSVQKQFLSVHGENMPLRNTNKGNPFSMTTWEVEKSCLFHFAGTPCCGQAAVGDLETSQCVKDFPIPCYLQHFWRTISSTEFSWLACALKRFQARHLLLVFLTFKQEACNRFPTVAFHGSFKIYWKGP